MERPALLSCLCYVGTQSTGRNASLKFCLPKGSFFQKINSQEKTLELPPHQRLGEIWPGMLYVLHAHLSHPHNAVFLYSFFLHSCLHLCLPWPLWKRFFMAQPSGRLLVSHSMRLLVACMLRNMHSLSSVVLADSAVKPSKGSESFSPTTISLLRSGTFLSQYTFEAFWKLELKRNLNMQLACLCVCVCVVCLNESCSHAWETEVAVPLLHHLIYSAAFLDESGTHQCDLV